MPVEIRASRAADGEALARMHVRAWRISYAGLADPTWVVSRPFAERAAEWTRYAAGEGVPMWVADDAGEVAALYVDPDRQREGVGRALLERAVEELRAAGFERATLWTLRDSPQSTGFYEANGWRRDGAEKEGVRFDAVQARYERAL